MAEEFQSGICGGTWWNPSRSSSLSPCSVAGIGMATDHMGSFLWSSSDHMLHLKPTTKSCEESNNSVSGDSSMVFQNSQKHQVDSDSGGSSSILLDSTLQMMNFCPSSSSTDWNHALLRSNRRAENNYRSLMQEELNSQIQKDWSPKSFTSTGDESSITILKSINQDFSSSDTCSGLSAGFPISSASYGYSPALLHSCFEPDPQPPQSLYTDRSMNFMSAAANYGTNSNDLSPSWPKHAPFLRSSSPKQQQPSGLHFTNNTPFWNATASTGLNNDTRSTGYFSSSESQFLPPSLGKKRNCSSLTLMSNNEKVRELGSVVKNKGSTEPLLRRPRIETPSPLPTFKVRKEKLGDRITALQQLVSPFGKTDTASVLHEAIEYIKFLQEQVNILTTPYMKQGTEIQQQQGPDKLKEEPESLNQDLKSRGLCLVPISSTFPVANETTADFWTPTFGGTFR